MKSQQTLPRLWMFLVVDHTELHQRLCLEDCWASSGCCLWHGGLV